MNALAVLFWLWLLVALGVYLYRVVRWMGRRGDPAPRDVTGPTAPLLGDATSAATGAPAAPPSASRLPPLIVDGRPVDPSTGAPAPPAAAVAGAGAASPASTPRSGTRPPVAEAVSGIQMPCDLAPLLGGSDVPDPRRVVFWTEGVSPIVVAGGLTAELERLGYTVAQTGLHTLEATRDDTVVGVTIHPDPAAFPTAPAGSLVVELET